MPASSCLLTIMPLLFGQAPILSRRKVFEASAHGCLKTEYCTYPDRASSVSWATLFINPRSAQVGQRPLASYFQTSALGSLRSTRQSHWVRIFNLRTHPLWGGAMRRRAASQPRPGFVAQPAHSNPLASFFQACQTAEFGFVSQNRRAASRPDSSEPRP